MLKRDKLNKATIKQALKSLSIRNRLLLATSLWLSGMLILAGLLIPKLVEKTLMDSTLGQLQIVMDGIKQDLVLDEHNKLTLKGGLNQSIFQHPQSTLYWKVTHPDRVLRSLTLGGKDFFSKKKGKALYAPNGEDQLFIQETVTLSDIGTVTIIVSIDDDPVEYNLGIIIGILWFVFFLIFIGVLALAVIQVQWSLRPLEKLQIELKYLKKGEKDVLNQNYPSEISPLVHDLNALLFHYQELLQRARNQAGNLSHSIKTPLSILNNQVADLPDEQRQQMSEIIQQLQHQITYHLGRSRMAGAANILAVNAKPCERVDAISMAFDKVYAARELVLVNEIDDNIQVAMDQTDLDEVLGNLIENAYKWSKSLIRVSAEVLDTDNQVMICIEDNGSGIEDEQLEHIVKRGVRLDETVAGTGLGLNIASEVVYSYQGELSFSKSSLGGLKAVLTLPMTS